MTPEETSVAVLAAAPYVSRFVGKLFGVEAELASIAEATGERGPLWAFKAQFAKKRVLREGAGKSWKGSGADASAVVEISLRALGAPSDDDELRTAKVVVAVFAIGDFNTWEVTEQTKAYVVLKVNRTTVDEAGEMKTVEERLKVPLVAPSTGAMALHKPVNPWLFNVRGEDVERTPVALSFAIVNRVDEGRCSMAEGIQGKVSHTIADGIGVRVPIPEAVNDMHGLVDLVHTVEEEVLIEAMQLLHRYAGLVVEPAGAAGLAGVLTARSDYAGARVIVPVCGSNVDPGRLVAWLMTAP